MKGQINYQEEAGTRKMTRFEQIKSRVFCTLYPTIHKLATIKEQRDIRKRMDALHKKQSSVDSILRNVENYLLEGGSLTVLECWKKFHTTELRKIVSRINQKHGWKLISSDWVEFDGKRFKRYHL